MRFDLAFRRHRRGSLLVLGCYGLGLRPSLGFLRRG